MFPCCVDIHGIVSTHVETVVLLTNSYIYRVYRISSRNPLQKHITFDNMVVILY